MRRSHRYAVLCVATTILNGALVARAADPTGNPTYQAWAKFAPGSSSHYDLSLEPTSGPGHMTMTTRLDSVDADKITVNTTFGNAMGGDGRTSSREYRAENKVAIPSPTGNENLTVGGKTYSCKVYDLDQDQINRLGGSGDTAAGGVPPGTKVHIKLWTCPDVPGAVVKMHSEAAIDQQNIVTEMALTSFDAK